MWDTATATGSAGPRACDGVPAEVDRRQVLVVDHDLAAMAMMASVLDRAGFEPQWCSHADQAVAAFHHARPDLVLLEVVLPGRDGLDICRQIRMQSLVPIIIVSTRCDTDDIVAGLDAGADDYIAKPFKPAELTARIRTRLRPARGTGTVLRVGDLVVDVTTHSVHRDGQPIELTPLEFDLLVALARRAGQVLSRGALLQEVWSSHDPNDQRLVNTHIQRLRAKIEPDPTRPQIIRTVRGIGYAAERGEPQPLVAAIPAPLGS